MHKSFWKIMAYTIEYLMNHDIDIFFSIKKELIIHIATAGAILPAEMASLDSIIIKNKTAIQNLDNEFEIEINPYLDKLLEFQSVMEKDLYLTEFIRIAKKGIITFDKTVVEDSNNPYYHVVAWPKYNLQNNFLEKLPIIETPDFISRNIKKNIQQNIRDSQMNNRHYDKFELMNGIY